MGKCECISCTRKEAVFVLLCVACSLQVFDISSVFIGLLAGCILIFSLVLMIFTVASWVTSTGEATVINCLLLGHCLY